MGAITTQNPPRLGDLRLQMIELRLPRNGVSMPAFNKT
jgi:hypothetical protein